MSEYFDAIVIFLIYDNFGAMQRPDSARMVCNICIFINSNLLLYKNNAGTSKI